MDAPFLRLDDRDYPEILTDAAVLIMSARGIDRFSVRAVARWMNVSPAAVLNDFSRARVLEMVNICFAKRWLSWSGSEPMFGPSAASVPLRLPAEPDEAVGVKVLDGLQLLADGERVRGNPAPGYQLDRLREGELALLRHRLETTASCCDVCTDDRRVLAVMALTRGLRGLLADAQPRLSQAEANEIVSGFVLSTHADGCVRRQ